MNYIINFFNFKGTINGTTYFLRNMLAAALGFFAGYTLGYGFVHNMMGLVVLGMVVGAIALTYQYSSLYKRVTALFPEYGIPFTIGIGLLQLIAQFVKEYEDINVIMTLVLAIIALILIFKNSNIEKHEG
jgi:hypothetical protein